MRDYIVDACFSKSERLKTGITAHRICEIREDSLIIGVDQAVSETKQMSVPMSDTTGLHVGDYLDFLFCYTRCNGKATNYSYRYLGKTPDQFIPDNDALYA